MILYIKHEVFVSHSFLHSFIYKSVSLCLIVFTNHMSHLMTKQQNDCALSKDSDQPGIRQVWSESSLSAWRNTGSLATHWAHSEDSDQTGRIKNFSCTCSSTRKSPNPHISHPYKRMGLIVLLNSSIWISIGNRSDLAFFNRLNTHWIGGRPER